MLKGIHILIDQISSNDDYKGIYIGKMTMPFLLLQKDKNENTEL